jgi:hypothetical protein
LGSCGEDPGSNDKNFGVLAKSIVGWHLEITIFDLKLLHEANLSVQPLTQEDERKDVFYNSNGICLTNEAPLRIVKVYNITRRRGNDRDCAIDTRHGNGVLKWKSREHQMESEINATTQGNGGVG